MNEALMASSKDYVDFILEQCSGLSARAMMGDYVLYYDGKVIGGIYDNRVLIKPTPSALTVLSNAKRESPYEGAKELLLLENVEDRVFLNELFKTMREEIPNRKKNIKS